MIGLYDMGYKDTTVDIKNAVAGQGTWKTRTVTNKAVDFIGQNIWRKCDAGSFMVGFGVSTTGTDLKAINVFQCATLSDTDTTSWGDCYEQETKTVFDYADQKGYCKQPGYYMAGLFKSELDIMDALDALYCCQPKYLHTPVTF